MYPGVPTFRYDILVIEEGLDSASEIARHCSDAGLATCIVRDTAALCDDAGQSNPPDSKDCAPARHLERKSGTCFAVNPHMFALLDPKSGDEIAFLETNAVIIASAAESFGDEPAGKRFMGMSKLGLARSNDGRIFSDSSGRTSVPNVFMAAAVSMSENCASAIGPGAAQSAIHYCKETHP